MLFSFSFNDYDSDGVLSPCNTVYFPLSCVGVLSFINSSAFSLAWNCPAYQTSFRRFLYALSYSSACRKNLLQFSVFFDSFSSFLRSCRDMSDVDLSRMQTFTFGLLPG